MNSILIIVACLIEFLQVANKIEIKGANESMVDFVSGFGSGVICAFILITTYQTVRLLAASKDEEKLKKLYIDETDERTLYIYNRIGGTFMTYMLVGQIVLAWGLAFVDVALSFGVIIALVIESVCRLVVKFYLTKNA